MYRFKCCGTQCEFLELDKESSFWVFPEIVIKCWCLQEILWREGGYLLCLARLLYDDAHSCCHCRAADVHIWLPDSDDWHQEVRLHPRCSVHYCRVNYTWRTSGSGVCVNVARRYVTRTDQAISPCVRCVTASVPTGACHPAVRSLALPTSLTTAPLSFLPSSWLFGVGNDLVGYVICCACVIVLPVELFW